MRIATKNNDNVCWIFGYGSLIWKPNFPFLKQTPAILTGWERRFFQASPDHRGTPSDPGRVVTLLPNPHEQCHGMAYLLDPCEKDNILEYLDIREQEGYELLTETIQLYSGEFTQALIYIASTNNPHFLGPAPITEIAQHIQRCHGPSGSNLDYFMKLRHALSQFAPADSHIESIYLLM